MKKVLIITYYWPPSGGGGVQRWVKMTKYLPEFGWEPIIFTPENPDFSLRDESLLQDVSPELEVLKFPIWEPYQLFNKLTGGKNQSNVKQGLVLEKSRKSWIDRLSIWLRGNLFLPDPRVFWVRPSVRFLTPFIQDRQIDLIITTGPPHSMHLIGKALKKKTGVKWLADFRDPWSDWDLMDKLGSTSWAKSLQRKMEKKVFEQADGILTVGYRLEKRLKEIGAKNTYVVHNGFDEEDFAATPPPPPAKFILSHTGLLNEMRDPQVLWQVLEDLCRESEEFASLVEIHLAGTVSESISSRLAAHPVLGAKLHLKGYLSHTQVLEQYGQSAVLLLILNHTDNAAWIVAGKLFEYLAAQRPILMLGPQQSDAADILRDTQSGKVAEFEDYATLKAHLFQLFEEYKAQKTRISTSIQAYSRKELTKKLTDILQNL
jgi:glycosyltransferase involved in cell wall biosynthesis